MADTLAAKVRAKFPGTYDDLSDPDLEKAVLAKHPEYADLAAAPATAAGPDWMERTANAVEGGVTNLAIGAVKGAGQTAVNLGKMVQKVPGVTRAVDALYGAPGISSTAMQEADRVLTPANTTQRVGKMGEQAAELILPARAIQRAGVEAAARYGPQLASTIGETAAKLLPNAAVQAAGGAGMSAAQGGNPVVGAVLGGAVPAIGAALDEIPASLREGASKKVMQALGPTKERYKAIAARLVPEIQKRGLGGSREALQQQAADTLSTVGEQLDQALTQYGGQAVTTQPVVNALETAKDAFRTTTQMPVAEAARKGLLEKATSVANGLATVAVEFEPRAIRQLDGLQKIITDVGDTATVEQLTGIRRAWDKVVSQAGGFAQRSGGAIGVPLQDQSEAWAKREASGAIRKLLADDVPDLAAINKEYSFWKNLDDVLTQTLQRTQPQGPGLLRQGAEAAGQVVGGMAGSGAGPAGTIGGAVVLGKVAKMAQTVLTSPRWRFVDAKLRNTLADAISSGSTSQIASTLGQISAVQTSKLATP